MTTADVHCGRCGNRWEYSGLAADSAICPRCSYTNALPERATGPVDDGPLYRLRDGEGA